MLKFHPLTLQARTATAEDAVCLTFEVPQELREDYRFEAGQHIALRLDKDGEDLRRTYSLACPADSTSLRIGVRVQPMGRMSPFLAKGLALGDTLDVLTPNGSFHTQIEPGRARRYVAMAAGSGITPVLSIAATVLAREPQSHFMLFYGNRTAASAMFLDDLMALKNRYPARLAVHCLMSREPQDIDLLNGRIDSARVRALASAFFDVANVDEFFLCGPGSMNDDVSHVLRDLGAKGRIHAELFTVAGAPADRAVVTAVVPAARTRVEQGATQVTVVMDGRRRVFSMAQRGAESILDAAGRAGFDLPYSCRAGVCSTCRAKVLKGKVEMDQNHALEDWELDEGFVLCCQAHPTTAELEITYDQ